MNFSFDSEDDLKFMRQNESYEEVIENGEVETSTQESTVDSTSESKNGRQDANDGKDGKDGQEERQERNVLKKKAGRPKKL